MTSLSALCVDELADGICLRAGRVAAAQAELLLWIAEFDRREGWAGPGMRSCAHWLSWRVGMSLGTARDQVRVARRLEDLPQLAAAFADGRVSYSKVRAITRLAEPDDGIDWVELARSSSAAQLDTLVRGVSRARAHEAAQDDPAQATWRLRTRTRYDEDGSFVLTIRGPAHLLPVVQAGLDAKKAQLQRERAAAAEDAAAAVERPEPSSASEPVPAAAPAAGPPEPSPADGPDLDAQAEGWPTGTTRRQALEAADHLTALQRALGAEQVHSERPRPVSGRALQTAPPPGPPAAHVDADPEDVTAPNDADALLALAQAALQDEHATRPEIARRRRWRLTAQIDPVSGWARQADGELLPPSSLTAVLKTLPGRGGVLRLRRLTAADLRRFDLGRDRREVTDNLRELLGAVDGERCRFPGCTRRRRLHAHHVVFWSLGGPTDLSNLVLVCSRHHTLIHAQGFRLELHPDRRLEVRTADRVPVLHHPAPPWGDPAELATGCGQLVSAETLPPDHTDGRLDLRYAVAVLMAQAA